MSDVVRHGAGPRSRIDLTITYDGQRARLAGVPAKQAPSYRYVTGFAMEEGLVLPYFPDGDRVWRDALAPAMKEARVEAWREGEEITRAIAAEIRSLLESSPRGERGCDLRAGKVVVVKGELFVSPSLLVLAVRRRLVDDVLPRAVVADAARRHLGMYPSRRRFADGERPCSWAFPVASLAWRETEDRPFEEALRAELVERTEASSPVHDTVQHDEDESDGTNGIGSIPSMDGGALAASLDGLERYEPDPLDGEDATGILDRSMDGPLGMVSGVTPRGCSDGPNGQSKNFLTGERDEGPRTNGTESILSKDGSSAGASLHGRERDERDGLDGPKGDGRNGTARGRSVEGDILPGHDHSGDGPNGRWRGASLGSHVPTAPKEVALARRSYGESSDIRRKRDHRQDNEDSAREPASKRAQWRVGEAE